MSSFVTLPSFQPACRPFSGDLVSLWTRDSFAEDKLKIQLPLNPEDYTLAVRAYQERLPIVCTGDLVKEDKAFILKNPRNFSLDDTWVFD